MKVENQPPKHAIILLKFFKPALLTKIGSFEHLMASFTFMAMKNERTLIFIADIYGFTSEEDHGVPGHREQILSEAAEVLQDANRTELKLLPAEGNTHIFYKTCGDLSLEALIIQAEVMFTKFHEYLKNYKTRRICRCETCRNAASLQLRFLLHRTGLKHEKPDALIRLQQLTQPYIAILQQNKLTSREYMILSDDFLPQVENFNYDKLLNKYTFSTFEPEQQDFHEKQFFYIQIETLKSKLAPVPPVLLTKTGRYTLKLKTGVQASAERVYTDITRIDRRVRWDFDVDNIRSRLLNRAGMVRPFRTGNDMVEVKTLGRKETNNTIEYGERTDNYRFYKQMSIFYKLIKKDDTTQVELEMHYDLKPIYRIIEPVIRFTLNKNWNLKLDALKSFSEDHQPEKE